MLGSIVLVLSSATWLGCPGAPPGGVDGGTAGGSGGAGGGSGGSAENVRVLASDPNAFFTSLATDGVYAYVATTGGDAGGALIRRVPLDGGTLQPFYNPTAERIRGMVSDGRHLFYATETEYDLRRLPLDGGAEVILGAYFIGTAPFMQVEGSDVYLLSASNLPGVALFRIAVDAPPDSGIVQVAVDSASTQQTSEVSISDGLAAWANFDADIYTAAVPGPSSVVRIRGDGGVVTGAGSATGRLFAARRLPQPSGPAKGQLEVWTRQGALSTVVPLSCETQRVVVAPNHVYWWEYCGSELVHRTRHDGTDDTVISTVTVNSRHVAQTSDLLLVAGNSGTGSVLWAIQK